MSLIQLRASLALWRARYKFRTARWNYWTRKHNKPGTVKWEKLRLEALDRIHLREHQIQQLEDQRPVTMYDSVTPREIPATAKAAAGYVNGRYANFDAVVARTPKAKHVSITINASGIADCLDVETSDATPEQAPAWVRREQPRLSRLGRHPKVYANLSTMPAVTAALHAAGISRGSYRLWVAHYDGVPKVPAGYDAKQYEEKRQPNVDVSVCNPSFFN